MTQENIEIVTRALDAYTRRDVAVLRALNDPEVELDWSASLGFQAGIYRGFETALGFYREYFEIFDQITFEIERVTDPGDAVIVANVAHQRGRDGIEVSARSTLVFTLCDGSITRIRLYQTWDSALTAVGLAE